jgi:hypothetical protein
MGQLDDSGVRPKTYKDFRGPPSKKKIKNQCFRGLLSGVNFTKKIPKVQKDSEVISVFLCFWDLFAQKLLLNC